MSRRRQQSQNDSCANIIPLIVNHSIPLNLADDSECIYGFFSGATAAEELHEAEVLKLFVYM